jgi:hypothetical protein
MGPGPMRIRFTTLAAALVIVVAVELLIRWAAPHITALPSLAML